MIERWRPIPGEPGYEAGDLGNVRSVDRVVETITGPRQYRGRVLAAAGPTRNRGYRYVNIRGRTPDVHVLVLRAWVGPPPPGHEGCHGNGDHLDDRLVNLRWDTRSANHRDAARHGTHSRTRRKVCPRDHRLVEPNLVRSQLANGRRSCLACHRAHAQAAVIRFRGGTPDLRALADTQYQRIMPRAA